MKKYYCCSGGTEYENLWNESGQHLERLHISSEGGENKKIKHVVIQTECFASMFEYIGSTVSDTVLGLCSPFITKFCIFSLEYIRNQKFVRLVVLSR